MCRKPLASPIYGGGGPADSGKARSRRVGGGAHFSVKSGHFRVFAAQICGLPPAFGHPPHKCGGQDRRFFDSLNFQLSIFNFTFRNIIQHIFFCAKPFSPLFPCAIMEKNAYRLESADLKYAQTTKSVIPRAKPVGISSTAVRPCSQPINIVNPKFSMLIGAYVITLRCWRLPRPTASQ